MDGSATAGGTRSKRQAAAPRAFREFGPAGHDYSRAEDDGAELNDEEAEAVDGLLRRRLQAKLARRFEEADELLEELRDMGVQARRSRQTESRAARPSSHSRGGRGGRAQAGPDPLTHGEGEEGGRAQAGPDPLTHGEGEEGGRAQAGPDPLGRKHASADP